MFKGQKNTLGKWGRLALHRERLPPHAEYYKSGTIGNHLAATDPLPPRDVVAAQAGLYYQEFELSEQQYFMPTKISPMTAFRDEVNRVIINRCLISTEMAVLGSC
jgi:hypothetical protein